MIETESFTDLFCKIENNFSKISLRDIEELNRAAQSICRSASARLKMGADAASIAADAVQEALIAISTGDKDLKKITTSRIYAALKGEQNVIRPEDFNPELSFDQFVISLKPEAAYDMRHEIHEADSIEMTLVSSKVEAAQERADLQNQKYASQLKLLIGSCALLIDDYSKSSFLHDFLKRRYIQDQSLAEIARSVHNIRKARQGISYSRAKIIESGLLSEISKSANLAGDQIVAILQHTRSAMAILRRLEWSLDSKSNNEIYELIDRPKNKEKAISFLRKLPTSLLSSLQFNMPQISPKRAARLRAMALPEMQENLNTLSEDPGSCFARLRSYQKFKLEKIIKAFINQNELTKHKLIADIAPPAAGKTYMMACLAKLAQMQGMTSLFVAHSNSVLYGEDGAIATFKAVLGEDQIGVANVDHQELGRTVTLTTYKSISSPQILERICHESKPFLFLFDEGDLSQTEIRQKAIETLSNSLSYPLMATFSATKQVAGKNLADRAYVSDEMKLDDLISQGYAKHILGFYVEVNLNADTGVIRHASQELNLKVILVPAEISNQEDYTVRDFF
jgi:hypothetical protein